MADELYLPQVDYTSRDYTSLSSDLKGLIENFAPQWTSRDSSDFGIVLLELFAYLGDILNYQIDRAANESFINTSTQRDTVLRIARLLNYVPNDISPATGTVTFSNYSTSPVTISNDPASTAYRTLSTVSDGTNPAIGFTVDSPITIPAGTLSTPATAAATVTQGALVVDELIGISDGTPNQEFSLGNLGVITGSTISVKVGTLPYTRVDFLIDYGNDDPVFSTYTDGAGITYIVFGDAVSGRIPTNGTNVTTSYRYSDTAGKLGNIAADKLTVISPTLSNIEVTNALSFSGGSDAETTDSVRINAPLSLRALNSAISLRDYISFAVQVNGVAKANSMSTSFGAVTVFVAAEGGNPLSSVLQSQIQSAYVDAVPPGTTVSIQDFTPVYPYVTVTVNVLPQYNAANVGAAVASELATLFAFDNVLFNDLINQGSLYAACNSVDGVAYVTLNHFQKFAVNPNSVSKIYSQSAVTTAAISTSATTVTVDSTVGLYTGARIISPVAFNNATISTVVAATNTITFSAAPTSVVASGTTITIQGFGTVTDLSCNVNEVPVYEPTYINVITSGGTS
jgi:hypothetical protein